METAKFNIGTEVKIAVSGESGRIVARTEYEANEPQYLLRYKTAQHEAVERWWPESALRKA